MPFAPETATLSLDQIAELIARKRRREAGDPYMEDRIALTESDQAGIYGMLDGQPLAGAEVVAGYEDYPNRQDTLAHEAGHRSHYLTGLLGTQAGPPQAGIDPYTETERIMTPEKDDRWHNVLYGESGPSYLSAVDRFEGTELASSAGDWIPIDQEAAARDSAIANQLAAGVDMRREGLLSEAVPLPPMLDRSGAEVEGFELRPKALLDAVTKPRTKSGSGGDVTPTTLKQAQSMGKAYFYQDGEKKLAVTGDQLAQFKKSDRYDADSKKSALTQWANIASKEGVSGLIAKPQKSSLPTGLKTTTPGISRMILITYPR